MEAAEIDKELEDLDTRIDQLRALYEQYFMGIERIEPQKPRQEIERRLKVLRKEQIRNTAQRFKFNVLVQRMNTMAQYWGRVVREIENGTFKRDVIRAAARFGETALTGLGKKRAAELAKVAAGQSKRPVDDAYELGADDLVEDWGDDLQEEEDEAPTPPKMELPSHPGAAYPLAPAPQMPYGVLAPQGSYPSQYAVAPAAPPSGRGLMPGDLPVIQADAGPASRPVPLTAPLPPPNPPSRSGLRWGSSDPSSSIRQAPADPMRRVAELAAELRGQKPQDEAPGFGALDLDFEDGASALPPSRAVRAVGLGAQPIPAPVVRPSAPAHVSAVSAGGFGVLDVSLDEAPSPVVPGPSPSSPGSGIRTGAAGTSRPLPQPALPRVPAVTAPSPARVPGASAPRPQAPAAASSGGDLGDQRFRQIYAKYVETKRSANESTAGVTYEKLAATLRAQTEKLRAQHPSKAVDFDVVIKDGKTHLKPVLK